MAPRPAVTTIHAAAERADLHGLACLLNCGSDVNTRDRVGKTALHCAAQKGHQEAVALLIERQADVHATATKAGWAATHLAAEAGCVDALRALLDGGADVNATAANGTTALHFSAFVGLREIRNLPFDRRAGTFAHGGLKSRARDRMVGLPPRSCWWRGVLMCRRGRTTATRPSTMPSTAAVRASVSNSRLVRSVSGAPQLRATY